MASALGDTARKVLEELLRQVLPWRKKRLQAGQVNLMIPMRFRRKSGW